MRLNSFLFVLFGLVGVFRKDVFGSSSFIQEFEDWMKEFSVEVNEFEYQKRLEIFSKNSQFIRDHNAGNSSYTMGHNKFSHMLWEEFRSLYLGFKAKDAKKVKAPLLKGRAKRPEHAADSVDWTDKGAVTNVKDQGACGSCWAFSAVEAIESALYLEDGMLMELSVQEVVDCDYSDYGCGGGLMDNAFKYVMSNGGLCTEDDYPYTAQTDSCAKNSCTNVEGSEVVDWVDVPPSEEDLMAAITQQPVSVAIEADQLAFQFYSGGVLTGRCGTNLDHGVVAVGYGEENGTKFWKVRNSWGSSWGDNGYIYLERGKSQYGDQCGILLQASYPVVESAKTRAKRPAAAALSKGNQVMKKAAAGAQSLASAFRHSHMVEEAVAEGNSAVTLVEQAVAKGKSAAASFRETLAKEAEESSELHSTSITASDCGGNGIQFSQFDFPSSVGKGSEMKITAHGQVVSSYAPVTGGDLDITVNLDDAKIFSHEADICGDSSISLPLHLGDIKLNGLDCPASDKVEYMVEFSVPIFAPDGDYSVLVQDTSDMVCVQINLTL